MNRTHEIIESVAGNGSTQWSVVTINADTGRWIWKEDFTTLAEAKAWLTHAC